MKIIKTLLFLICTACLITFCNTKAPVAEDGLGIEINDIYIADSTVYSVVSYLLKNEMSNPFLKYKRVLQSAEMPFYFAFTSDSLEIVRLDSIFTPKDIEYMQAQKKQFYKFKLDQANFDYKTIIPNDSLENAKSYPYCYISFPVFNFKLDKFIVRTGYGSGILSAESPIFIYQKFGKDWKIMKILNQTLS